MEEVKKIENIMRYKNPILFIGAGFSHGAKKDSDEILMGEKLLNTILTDYLKLSLDSDEYKELSKSTMSEICDFAESETSKNSFQDYLRSMFNHIKPLEHHKILFKYPWTKIYTTNIDDLVENVARDSNFNLSIQNSHRRIKNKNYNTEYVKLHGCVNNSNEPIVFSADSYMNSMVKYQVDYRYNSFILDLQKSPFIFVGTEFHEWNLDYYLKLYEKSGKELLQEDIVFVNPNPSIKLKRRIKNIDAILVSWSTKDFLDYIEEHDVQKINLNSLENRLRKNNLVDKNIVKQLVSINKKYRSKLLYGIEPKWEDVYDGWDAKRYVNDDLVGKIEMTNKNYLFVIISNYYSGKSIIAKRLFAELIKKDIGYALFHTGKIINDQEIKQVLSELKERKILLIIDDATDNYNSIRRLVESNFDDKSIIIICFSRGKTHLKKHYALPKTSIEEIYLHRKLKKAEIDDMLRILEEKNLVGKLSEFKSKKKKMEKIKSFPDLISFLYYLTESDNFLEKIKDEINGIKFNESELYSIILLLSIMYLFNASELPKELIPMISELDYNSITSTDDFIQVLSNDHLKIRNYLTAKTVVKHSSKKEISNILRSVAKAIAPQVSESRMNEWKLIYQKLFREKSIRAILNLSTSSLRELYEDIQDYYRNSSFFYLQLGTLEQEEHDFDRAASHFQAAKSINPYSYQISHAIGRNYLRKANNSENISQASIYFEEGEKLLNELIISKEKEQSKLYSIHCLLFEKITFYEKFNHSPTKSEMNQINSLLDKVFDDSAKDYYILKILKRLFKYLHKYKKIGLLRMNLTKISSIENEIKLSGIDIKEGELDEYDGDYL